MMTKSVLRLFTAASVSWMCSMPLLATENAAGHQAAQTILDAAGVSGGLVVHVGCGDGKLTSALHANDRYLVHGVDVNAVSVEKARAHILSCGRYGPVSCDTYDGRHLPYADNLVNLILISEADCQVPDAEINRVLCPGGAAVRLDSNTREAVSETLLRKPWPEEMDQWTHHLHDAGGNAVGSDRLVGPPARLRWTAGPLWARSHGWTPSVSAMVSANGRLFTICDETLTCADGTAPSKWFLIARDAFNGVLLWKRPVPDWDSKSFSGTPDTGGGVTTGRFTMPPNIGKRLVAVDDTVYVTLGSKAPVSALDAATGQEKHVYAETSRADEILCADGRLIVSTNPPAETENASTAKHICAIEPATGRLLWKRGPFSGIRATKGQDPLGRLELAAGDDRVFALTTDAVECLDAESGENLWRIDRPLLPPDAVRRIGFAGMYEYLLAVLVYHDGVVLLAQPEPNTHHTYHTMPGALYAFDADDGRQMWKHGYGGWGHCTPPDVFVVGDVVWTHVDAKTEYGSVWQNGLRAANSAVVDYRIQALDLQTGELRKELSTKDIFNVGHHHRCYRNKITERFLLSCRRGVEFVDLTTGENYQNHWVRSGCLLGYLPCNGLLYVTPHPCGCYLNAKLTGFNALAPRSQDAQSQEGRVTNQRLERGPAYDEIRPSSPEVNTSPDWPTYRHDSQRSGATEARVGENLRISWSADIGTEPSGLVVSGGRVLVAGVDTHTIYALDVEDGRRVWRVSGGARVDSPPTLHNGTAIFGSADGRVHCVRASDGATVWQFDAAPRRRLVTAFGQLESARPVPGSVLVRDGQCWFAAGRSSYLDGGISVYALDASTGEVLRDQTVYDPDPETGQMQVEPSPNTMQGMLNDIPVSDGTNVFIRQMQLTAANGRGGQRLFPTGGFRDSSWFNRTQWQIGPAKTSGLMVLGRDVAIGAELYASKSRETVFRPGSNAYRLVCLPLKSQRSQAGDGQSTAKRRKQQGPTPVWEQRLGIRVTAMVRAADVVFVGGSPDVVVPGDPHAAWEGRAGGLLAAFAADSGEKLAEYDLPAPPVWDGMAAIEGHLFLGTTDGNVLCMEASR